MFIRNRLSNLRTPPCMLCSPIDKKYLSNLRFFATDLQSNLKPSPFFLCTPIHKKILSISLKLIYRQLILRQKINKVREWASIRYTTQALTTNFFRLQALTSRALQHLLCCTPSPVSLTYYKALRTFLALYKSYTIMINSLLAYNR